MLCESSLLMRRLPYINLFLEILNGGLVMEIKRIKVWGEEKVYEKVITAYPDGSVQRIK